ncbi:MAG: DUF378 domain-containing protein [Dehalococcoidia bacterium]|nr:DUF378 domain-containing protein [Dehalococcoidia bacterium]
MDFVIAGAIILAVVGALNWGLVGLARFDLVAAVTGNRFGEVNPASRLVYILVMVAGLVSVLSIPAILD